MSIVPVPPGRLGPVLRAHRAAVSRAMKTGMKLGAQRGRTHLVQKTPVDTGQMKNAWEVQRAGGGYDVDNTAPHAGIVERGARPHSVSDAGILALERWAMRQLGVKDEQEAHAVAMGIAWKIRNRGQEPTWVVRDSLDDLRRYLGEETDRAIRKVADKPPVDGSGGAK